MAQNTLIYAKDETNNTRVLKCTDEGALTVGLSAEAGSTISIADFTTPENTLTINSDGEALVDIGAEVINLSSITDIENKNALVVASENYAYNKTSNKSEKLTYSNILITENEEYKNRLDTSTILEDPTNNNKAKILPLSTTQLDTTDNALVVSSVLYGKKSAGNFEKINSDDSGNLKVSVDNGNIIVDSMPNLDATTDSITIYGLNPSSVKTSIMTDANGHLDIVGNVGVNLITGFNLEATQTTVKDNTNVLNSLKFTNAPDSYLKVSVQNFPSTSSTVNIQDTDGNKLNAVSSSIPQLKTTLYDKVGNNIASQETSSGSGVYALQTYNQELNYSYNATAHSIQTAPQIYDGTSYHQQKGDAQGRAEVNINSSGTAITHTGTSLDVEVKNTGNINVSVQNSSLNTHIMGYDDNTLTYKDVSVDSNGFINVIPVEAVHQNIEVGFDENVDSMTKYKGSGYLTWKAQNPYCKEQNGWYVSGDSSVGGAMLSWYNNGDFIAGGGNPTIPFNPQYSFTKADIDIFYMIIQNYNCNSLLATFPFIYVMSKPTGTGDYAPYAHSIWVYSIDANQFINNGSSIMIYNGNLARVKNNDVECPRVSYSLVNTLGAGGSNEIIGHITAETLIYPSGTGNIDLNVIEGAIYVKNKGLINYYFNNNRENIISGVNVFTDKSSTSVTSNILENSTYSGVGLDTRANLYASYTTGGAKPLTYTATSTPNVSYSLDTYIQNSSTTNYKNIVGLNTYQIFPNRKCYCMAGYAITATFYNIILGGYSNTTNFNSYDITDKAWYYNWTFSTGFSWTMKYDYVDVNGVLQENQTMTINSTGVNTVIPTNDATNRMKGIIKWNIVNNYMTQTSSIHNFNIMNGNGSQYSVGGSYVPTTGTYGQTSDLMGVFTVPTTSSSGVKYVAYVPNLSFIGGVNINFGLAVIKADGTKKILNRFYYQNGTSKEVVSGSNGYLGEIFEGGDRIIIIAFDSSALTKWCSFNVVLEAV